MTFRIRHLLLALALHAALVALLAGGAQCSRKMSPPVVIEAVLLDPDRKQIAERKRRDDLARQRAEAQRRKALEEEKRRKEEEAQRRKEEAERKKQAELEERRKAEVAAQQKAEEARKKKEAEAARARDLEAKKKADAETRRKQEEEQLRRRAAEEAQRREQALAREALQRELEQEEQARAQAASNAKLAEWKARLEHHIQKNWIRPPSLGGEYQCTVRVQILPDGTVSAARVERKSGNAAIDKSVEDAVYRSSPLPLPEDRSVLQSDLIINFDTRP